MFLGIIGLSLVGGGIIYYMGKDKDEDDKGIEQSNKDAAVYKQASEYDDDYQKQVNAEKEQKEKEEEEENLLKRFDSNDSDVSFTSLTQGGYKRRTKSKKCKRQTKSKKSKRRSNKSKSKSKSKSK